MQRTHSSNSRVMFLLLAIAIVATTFGGAQAQTNNEKPVQAQSESASKQRTLCR